MDLRLFYLTLKIFFMVTYSYYSNIAQIWYFADLVSPNVKTKSSTYPIYSCNVKCGQMGKRLHMNVHVWQLAKTILSFVGLLTPHGKCLTTNLTKIHPKLSQHHQSWSSFVKALNTWIHHICGCSTWPLQPKLQAFWVDTQGVVVVEK